MRALRALAERTPATRERYVDLLRAVAIVAVVLGHWLVSVVGYDEHGRVVGRSALPYLPWAYPITWIVQVMPIFFLVGGYANAASLTSHRHRGGTALTWLQGRAGRLLGPTTVLMLVLAAGALIAQAVPVDPAFTRRVVWVASIPLWFLAAYLVVVAATPVMLPLHQRYGWRVLAVLVLLVACGDVARLTGHEALGLGNFVFGWLAIHQVGFAWREGQLRLRPAMGAALLFGGLAALVGLTVAGPYPVSMIDVPGQRLLNASPPTLALLVTFVVQLGLVVLLHGPAQRWLRRPTPWRLVVGLNAVVLTVFLWHMMAVVLLVGLLWALGWLPTPAVASASWWLWRPPWLLLLTIVLAGLVAVFGRFELRPRTAGDAHRLSRAGSGAPGVLLTVLGYAAAVTGLLANNLAPNSRAYLFGMPVAGLVLYLTGAGVLRALRGLPAPGRE